MKVTREQITRAVSMYPGENVIVRCSSACYIAIGSTASKIHQLGYAMSVWKYLPIVLLTPDQLEDVNKFLSLVITVPQDEDLASSQLPLFAQHEH